MDPGQPPRPSLSSVGEERAVVAPNPPVDANTCPNTPTENRVPSNAAPSSAAVSDSKDSTPSHQPPASATPQLRPGERIEVLWTIERDENEVGEQVSCDEQRWWGAEVKRPKGEPGAYVVLYDAYAEFAPAEVDVVLVGPRVLLDGSVMNERMVWRREGDESVTAEEEVTGGNEKHADVCSMNDVVRAQEEVDAEDGVNSGAEMMAALSQLPVTQQADLGAMYREFADEMKTQLAQLMSQKGPGYVVTQENIAEIMVRIKNGRRANGRAPI